MADGRLLVDVKPEFPPLTSQSALDAARFALRERYTIEREIGHGGSAYVFLAHDLREDRQVALKTLRPELANAVSATRFLREVEIARELRHPNIIELLDSGWVDGMLYYTVPFIAGETLRDRLQRERQLPIDDALRIARDVAVALEHAHERNIVHRDIKPANILLDGGHALVADFGIARAMTAAETKPLTESGIALGTPEYMSPEQATGDHHVDARADIYALGCVIYEMIAGEPPFTGPTTQAILARHAVEAPRSIRVVRRSVTPDAELAINKALAKIPADRYERATAFVDALERGMASRRTPWHAVAAQVKRPAVLTTAVALAALGAYVLWPRPGTGDPNRIVVFPLHEAQMAVDGDAGESVATYIGYALDGTQPLKWLDGWELLQPGQRASAARLSTTDAARIARAAGAGFYIDGSILRHPDSSTVILRLYSVDGDSLVSQKGVSAGANAPLPQLGLRAIASLLPSLLAPGRSVDVSALSDRHPTAVANFLQGERDYRRLTFASALEHYSAAVAVDSGFALAALKGAAAANWTWEVGMDRVFADVAMRGLSSLPPAMAALARGIHAYLNGAADTAIVYLRQVVDRDSSAHALTLLGETYLRLLPSQPAFDSLGRAALDAAHRRDADFAPALLLLHGVALRDGDVTAATLLDEALRHAGADTSHAESRRLMVACVRDGATRMDWREAVRRDQVAVLSVGKVLAGRAAKPECAIAAFRALVTGDSVSDNRRWAALMGLTALSAATGRPNDIASSLEALGRTQLPLGMLYLLAAAAGAGFEGDAARVADSLASNYQQLSTSRLYSLGSFEASRDSAGRLRAIVAAMRAMTDSTQLRRDSLVTRALSARLALVTGDSAGALRRLRALAPTGTRADIEWQPWESLGFERLLLSQLLLARGEPREAIRVASLLDATEPVIYPLFLRGSLDVRRRAAAAINDGRAMSEYDQQLARMSVARP